MQQRLDKIVASQGTLSRSEVKRAIRSGRVMVGDRLCLDPSQKCDPEQSVICVDGAPLAYRAFLYIMMNKPAGILCVSRDPKAPTVLDLLPDSLRRKELFPAGRLDKDTVGLVIITNDGAFAHRLLSPTGHVVKRYQARLDAPVGVRETEAFAAGIVLADGTRCRPAVLRVLPQGEGLRTEVEITEGKYHQVRRMFGAVGRRVLALKRCAIGGLPLDPDLTEGACRELSEAEKRAVFEMRE